MSFVVPSALRWPYQSPIGDALQFFALNTFPSGEEPRGFEQRGLKEVLRQQWQPAPLDQFDLDIGLDQLRYCAECWKLGYHSLVHLAPWVTHCPFHVEEAVRVSSSDDSWKNIVRSVTASWLSSLPAVAPIIVAKRLQPPQQGIALIEKYLHFVESSKAFREEQFTSFVRSVNGGLAEPAGPALTRKGPLGADRLRDAAIAATILARRLGSADLLTSIMRTPVPHTVVFELAACVDESYPSPFEGKTGPYWDFPTESASTQAELVSWGDPKGTFSMRPPCRPDTPQAVVDVHLSFESAIKKAAESGRGCARALAEVLPERPNKIHPTCAYCRAVRFWRHIVLDPSPGWYPAACKGGGAPEHNRGLYQAKMLQRSWPYLRSTGLEPTRDVDSVRERFLLYDTAYHFFGTLEAEIVGPYFEDYAWGYWETLSARRYLFESFLAVWKGEKLEVHLWNLPDLPRSLRDAMNRCCEDQTGSAIRQRPKPSTGATWLLETL